MGVGFKGFGGGWIQNHGRKIGNPQCGEVGEFDYKRLSYLQ